MFKKTVLSFAVFVLFTALVTSSMSVQAKESFTQNRGDEKKAEVKTNIQEKKTEIQENVQAKKENVASNHADRLEKRFALYTKRLTSLADKIQTRIDKREQEGKKNGDAQLKVDTARKQLVLATELGAEAVKMFRAIEPAKYTEQRDQAIKARDKAKEARKAFVETHRLLREAIQEMNEGKDS